MPQQPFGMISGQAVPGNSTVALMARLRAGQAPTSPLVTMASISGITYGLTDIDLTPPAVLTTGSFVVASVIFDALQQGDLSWQVDSANNLGQDGAWGWNFKALLPNTAIPVANSGHRMQCDVVFTPTTGTPFRVSFRFPTFQVFV